MLPEPLWKVQTVPMMRLLLALLAGWMGLWSGSVVAAEPSVPTVGLADVWGDHPVVAQTRAAGLWDEPALRWLAEPGMPLDRVWALAEVLPASQVQKQRLAGWLTGRLLALHAVGPSGALRPADIRVTELSAEQALALGWLRLLDQDRGGPLPAGVANRSGNPRVLDASPLDLLLRGAQAAPHQQAAHVAAALVTALVSAQQPRTARCSALQALAAEAAQPRSAALPRAAVERVVRWVQRHGRDCPPMPAAVPADWPAPAPWPTPSPEPAAQRPPPAERTATGTVHPFGQAFALTAPFFKAWVQDAAVQGVLQRRRLWASTLAEALAADATGDRAVVLLNAALHLSSLSVWDGTGLVWEALRLRHAEWPSQLSNAHLPVDTLPPGEALALGYARAVAADWLRPAPAKLSLATARAQDLLDHARRVAALDSIWAPWLWQLLALDMQRERDPCAAAARASTLAEVLAKSEKMPEAAKASLALALRTLAGRCPAAAPTTPPTSSPTPPGNSGDRR